MSELKEWCYTASHRVMAGLAQELKISPQQHYRPTGHNAARVLSLRLVGVNPHYLPKIKTMRDPLTMWAGLSDRTPVRIGQDGQAVIIEIPKPGKFWAKVTIEHLERRRYIKRGPIATLGLGLQDDPKRINFNDPAVAHLLITGATRSGKTNTERLFGWNIAHNTSPSEANILIFDVAKKGYKWADFGNVMHLAHSVITDLPTADRALCWLTQEIERRAEQHRKNPRLFVIIDELKALADDSKVATAYLARIASTGAEFGLHLILSTQYPQIQMLGSAELKRNVTTRLCGRVDDAQAAVNAVGLPDSGAETLQGYGDFLLRDFGGLTRLAIAKLEQNYVDQLPQGRIEEIELPELEEVNSGPKSSREPDPLEPEQIALALFNPMGINRLADRLSIGSTKAKRVKLFAGRIRQWAIEHGYNSLET